MHGPEAQHQDMAMAAASEHELLGGHGLWARRYEGQNDIDRTSSP